MSPDTHF